MSDWLPPMPTRPNTPAVLWVVGLTCLPEILFTLFGGNLFGLGWMRSWAVVHFAFWPPLLEGVRGLYPFQDVVMFISYAFLHGNLMHLIGNMAVTLALAGIVVARTSDRGFVAVYLVSAIGGGIGYALLWPTATPMVGASGAVFGLIGAWKYWEWQDRRRLGASMRPLWMSLVGLVLLNVLLFVFLSGLLAWQAHLGGFLAGAAWAATVSPRRDGPTAF